MSTLQEQFTKPQSLLRAVNAITHRPALITIHSACILAMLSYFGWILIGPTFGVTIVSLVFLLAALVGISATGYLLNDKAHGRKGMTIRQAFVSAIASFPRLIGVLALLLVFALLAAIVVGLVAQFVGKLLDVRLLFSTISPVSVVFLSIVFYACALFATLAGPSIWSHNGIARTLSLMVFIFRERLISVAVQLILLLLLVALVACFVSVVLVAGGFMVGTIATYIFPSHGSSSDLTVVILGAFLFFGLASCLILLVVIAGICIIFANATAGLPTEKKWMRSCKVSLVAA